MVDGANFKQPSQWKPLYEVDFKEMAADGKIHIYL